jgi:CheY-like chemotaxis protein/anti-sigma regulatory factor (Ser/Thr protein kinase)
MGDPQRLQQVVWNLLSNAVKFTPQHGVVELNLARADRTARITVRDTGCGISPDLLPHLFEPFHQGKDARRLGGLGLGLAIVQQIVALHGGTVRAESAGDGQGTTVIVELPVSGGRPDETDAERMEHGDQHGTAPAFASLPGVHVLIVEDEADARDLLVAVLQRAGADVFAVASSIEALRTLNQWQAEILVSDIGLPDEDGYALIHKVRALDPDHGGTIPAIALTANARMEDRARALAAGFQRHMAKPVDPAELTRAIAQIVECKQLLSSEGRPV